MTQMYMTQPKLLPLKLPSGVRALDEHWMTDAEVTFDGRFYRGIGWFRADGTGGRSADNGWSPGLIDWTTVPIESVAEDLGFCAACGAKAELSPTGKRAAIPSWCDQHHLGHEPVALCGVHWGMGTDQDRNAELADMIRSRRAASEIKHGEYCSGVATKDGSRVVGYVGFDHGWKESGRKLIGLYERRDDSNAPLVFVDTLRREEEPKSTHLTDSNPDPEIEQFLPKQPKADPYADHRLGQECSRGFAMWSALQIGTASGLLKADREEADERARDARRTIVAGSCSDWSGARVPVTHPSTWPSVGDDEP